MNVFGASNARPPRPRKRRLRPDELRNALRQESRKLTDKHPPSSSNAFILLLGPSDGGKSTTLNTLFGERELSPVERETGTSEILEFRSNKLHIIDSPGLGSPNSLEWDARILGSLKMYLDKHKELRKSIPHIVLIVARIDDPKLHHVNSTFVKSLKAISLLAARLFSNEYCNLIVLLTHFMTEKKSVRENPNSKIQLVRDLVRTHLDRSCHVIFGDNEAEDWGLPRMEWGHRLPTGDIYPGNLIDLVSEIIRRSGMELTVFQNRSKVEVVLENNFPLVDVHSARFRKSFETVKWAYDRQPNV